MMRRQQRKVQTMHRISRLATTVLVSGSLGLAGFGLAAGTAQADPFGHVGGNCPSGHTCGQWCPGESRTGLEGVKWDWSVCHNYVILSQGIVDVDTGAVVYAWPHGPIAPAKPAPPPPPGPPPNIAAQCPGLIPFVNCLPGL